MLRVHQIKFTRASENNSRFKGKIYVSTTDYLTLKAGVDQLTSKREVTNLPVGEQGKGRAKPPAGGTNLTSMGKICVKATNPPAKATQLLNGVLQGGLLSL